MFTKCVVNVFNDVDFILQVSIARGRPGIGIAQMFDDLLHHNHTCLLCEKYTSTCIIKIVFHELQNHEKQM